MNLHKKEFKNFEELTGGMQKSAARGAIAGAGDKHTIDFLLYAKERNITPPILVGDKAVVEELLRQAGENPADYEVVNAQRGNEAQRAVELVKDGTADFLMKGMLETSDFLRPVVKRENGLRGDGVMSYVALMSFPAYKKLLLCTDGGMIPYPDYEAKKKILKNALEVLWAIGYERPKAAVLCCKETVDEKMPETVDAANLARAAKQGEFGECVVQGPLSYDVCMSPEIAKMKKFDCPDAGDFDILLFPNIHCGNIFVKSLIINCGAVSAGLIAGCKVPVIAPSRGSSAEEQFLSFVLANAIAERRRA